MTTYRFTNDSTPLLPSLDRRSRRETRADEFAAALLSGAAWDRWCDGLKAAGRAVLDSQDAVSDTDKAEGFRYLMGLAYHLMLGELYETDSQAPAFTLTASDVVKWGLDNPDATLLSAPLSVDGVFRVYGSARAARMVEFVISNSGRPVIRQLDEFERDADGSFSILLSKSPQPGNWMELPEGATGLLVRRAFYDWDLEEVPHIGIQRLDVAPDVLARCLRTPTAADVGEQLDAMAVLVEEHAAYWIAMVHSFRSDGDNVISPPRPLPSTGMNAARSSVKGFYVLEPGEALVVTFRPPGGTFWSICLGDIWYRTIEYSHHQTSLNGHQARVDSDGLCRFVICDADPGVANWLDTVGHPRGVVCLRWVNTEGRPQPETEVVLYDQLDRVLPSDTARITPTERVEAMVRRRKAVARRWGQPLTSRWSYSTATIDPDPVA